MKISTCEALASRETRKRPGAELRDSRAPTALCPPRVSVRGASVGVSVSNPLSPVPVLLAGIRKLASHVNDDFLNKGSDHTLLLTPPEMVGSRVFKVQWAITWLQCPLGTEGLSPTLRPAGGAPWPLTARLPGSGFLTN